MASPMAAGNSSVKVPVKDRPSSATSMLVRMVAYPSRHPHSGSCSGDRKVASAPRSPLADHDPYPVPPAPASVTMPPGAMVTSSGGSVVSCGEVSTIQAPTAGCSAVAWADTPGDLAGAASSRVARTMAVDARRRMG